MRLRKTFAQFFSNLLEDLRKSRVKDKVYLVLRIASNATQAVSFLGIFKMCAHLKPWQKNLFKSLKDVTHNFFIRDETI